MRVLDFVLLGAVVAAISVTLTKSSLFRPVRMWLGSRTGGFWRFLARLIDCPYCTSHWIAALVVGVTDRHFLHVNPVVDFIVTGFLLVTLAAPFSWLIYNSYVKMHPLE